MIISSATPHPTSRSPKHNTFALLCLRESSTAVTDSHAAARTPLCLLATIETPIPEPQTMIPLSHSPLEIDVEAAWKSLMGNGVNSYTKEVVLKGSTLYVALTSAVLREELSYGKQKIISMLNEELRKEVVKDIVLR